jgi:hypothetical protein
LFAIAPHSAVPVKNNLVAMSLRHPQLRTLDKASVFIGGNMDLDEDYECCVNFLCSTNYHACACTPLAAVTATFFAASFAFPVVAKVITTINSKDGQASTVINMNTIFHLL